MQKETFSNQRCLIFLFCSIIIASYTAGLQAAEPLFRISGADASLPAKVIMLSNVPMELAMS